MNLYMSMYMYMYIHTVQMFLTARTQESCNCVHYVWLSSSFNLQCIMCSCMSLLQILEKKKYRGKVEKIKTIGSTYMAATGLGEHQVNPSPCLLKLMQHLSPLLPSPTTQPETEEQKEKYLHQNVVMMTQFAFELMRVLNRINREIFNDLKMRIGTVL